MSTELHDLAVKAIKETIDYMRQVESSGDSSQKLAYERGRVRGMISLAKRLGVITGTEHNAFYHDSALKRPQTELTDFIKAAEVFLAEVSKE